MTRTSLYPSYSLSDAAIIAKTIIEKNGGNPMRRLTLFNILERSPESGTSRALVTASSGYGLTVGSYAAEEIKITERGKAIVENDAQATLDAVLSIEIFKAFYEQYKNNIVPLEQAAIDFLGKLGLEEKKAKSCFKVILANGEQLFLIQEISGVKRIVSSEHALEKLIQEGFINSSKNSIDDTPTQEQNLQSDSSNGVSYDLPNNKQNVFTPNLHIDVQIHISADAKSEQIDQIFASMAKHIYGRE